MPLAGASLSDSLHDREAGASPRGTIDDGDEDEAAAPARCARAATYAVDGRSEVEFDARALRTLRRLRWRRLTLDATVPGGGWLSALRIHDHLIGKLQPSRATHRASLRTVRVVANAVAKSLLRVTAVGK